MTTSAVIWDIDGTLIDSEPLHYRALLATCRHYGVDISDLPVDQFVGVNMPGVWHALSCRFPDTIGFDQWLAELNDYYVEHSSELRPIVGAVETIAMLHDMGFVQAAASNSNRRVVDANLDILDATRILRCSISLDDVTKGKPDAEPYLRALAALEADPAATLAIEDSATGMASAKAARLRVVGYGDVLLGADLHVSDLRQIPDILRAG